MAWHLLPLVTEREQRLQQWRAHVALPLHPQRRLRVRRVRRLRLAVLNPIDPDSCYNRSVMPMLRELFSECGMQEVELQEIDVCGAFDPLEQLLASYLPAHVVFEQMKAVLLQYLTEKDDDPMSIDINALRGIAMGGWR